MPSSPAVINQNVAPGPPVEMATATPAMFPIPTVPETAVASALNCEISPGIALAGVAAGDDAQRLREPPHVDEAQVDREEEPAGHQPQHDERHLGPEQGDRVEDEAGHGVRHRAHHPVDELVDVHALDVSLVPAAAGARSVRLERRCSDRPGDDAHDLPALSSARSPASRSASGRYA